VLADAVEDGLERRPRRGARADFLELAHRLVGETRDA
jgi:hypothetical protein